MLTARAMVDIRLAPQIDADVIVVGAGPAGSSAAANAAAAGLSVVILDAKTFPRDKVCGDFVGPVALQELRRLGVADTSGYRQTNIVRAAALHLDGKELITHGLPRMSGLPSAGRVIPRLILDNWVLEAAVRSGARFLPGARAVAYEVRDGYVEVQVNGKKARPLRCRLLIGADGSTSTTARILRGAGPSRRDRIVAIRAYYENVQGPSDLADLYFSAESFPGYYWLFPAAQGLANVGVGMVLDTVPPVEDHLRTLLFRLIGMDPALQKRLTGARPAGKVVGFPLDRKSVV